LRPRLITLVASLLLLPYSASLEVWLLVGLDVVLSTINVLLLWRMLRTRHDARSYAVVEVRTDDAYLGYVLARHRADIARLNPGFTPEPPAADAAYLVLHGDSTVGVVLVREAGETAEVLLDWVTPAYRDFSPGEFVFRDSGLFSGRGVRRVLSPAGMQNPYYERIGFRPEGDRWVLDVEPERD